MPGGGPVGTTELRDFFDNASPGDLLLYKRWTPVSFLQSVVSSSYFTHVAMVVRGPGGERLFYDSCPLHGPRLLTCPWEEEHLDTDGFALYWKKIRRGRRFDFAAGWDALTRDMTRAWSVLPAQGVICTESMSRYLRAIGAWDPSNETDRAFNMGLLASSEFHEKGYISLRKPERAPVSSASNEESSGTLPSQVSPVDGILECTPPLHDSSTPLGTRRKADGTRGPTVGPAPSATRGGRAPTGDSSCRTPSRPSAGSGSSRGTPRSGRS